MFDKYRYTLKRNKTCRFTVPDRGGKISSCGLAARRLSWDATVRVWNAKQRGG